MCNETGTIWITFNGEIYNYRELRAELLAAGHAFQSASDTEVLLHGYEQWGIEGILKRLLAGCSHSRFTMRSVAAQGDGAPFFFAARDRLGIKPLYYSISRKEIAWHWRRRRRLPRVERISTGGRGPLGPGDVFEFRLGLVSANLDEGRGMPFAGPLSSRRPRGPEAQQILGDFL